MKIRFLISLYMSTLLGLAMTLVGCGVHGAWGLEFLWEFLFSLLAGFVFSFCLPIDKLASALCERCHLTPEQNLARAFINALVENLCITTLMALAMTAFALREDISHFWAAFIGDYFLMLIVGYVFAFLGGYSISLFMIHETKKKEQDHA
jgi:hypothetical protein